MSSSILNESPRLQIRNRDNFPGSTPTVINSFGDGRTGVRTIHFNDQNTVIFKTSDNVSYPHVLDETSAYLSASSLSRTGSSIVTSGAIVKGVSDTTLVNLYDVAATPGPFIEDGLFEQVETDFFLTGTSPSILPGFDSPLSSKTIIRIDLSTNEEQILTRYADGRGSVQDPGGRFLGQNFTGFCYYNFDLKRWEQKGLEDPGTGGSDHFDYAVERDAGLDESSVISGTGNFPLQFIPDPGHDRRLDSYSPVVTQLEYDRIGTPTVSCFGPFANQYHATSSQTIKLKDYIQHPFLLEKAVVHLPIEAEKGAADFFEDFNFIVNQDNYVFFIYRQERNILGSNKIVGIPETGYPIGDVKFLSTGNYKNDSPLQITSSLRSIVLSASIAFYNATASFEQASFGFPGRGSADVYTFSPSNTPAFEYDWGIDPFATGVSSRSVLGQFTGSVTLEALPAVASAQTLGHFRVPRATTPIDTKDITRIWNYWPGGTTVYPFGPEEAHGKWYIEDNLWNGISQTAKGTFIFGREPVGLNIEFGYPTFNAYSDPNSVGTLSFKDIKGGQLPIEKPDPRVQKIFGGKSNGISRSGINITYEAEQSAISPYLLFPDDELVIGFDAGLGIVDGMRHCNMTGSLLKIKPGQARLTLYGSLVKGTEEFHQGINQELTSDSVIEYLHFDNVPVDQFEIFSRENYGRGGSQRVFAGNISSNDNDDLFDSSLRAVGARRVIANDTSYGNIAKRRIYLYSPPIDFRSKVILRYDWLLRGFVETGDDQPTKPLTRDRLFNKGVIIPRKKYRQMAINSLNERYYDTLLPSVADYLIEGGYESVGAYIRNEGFAYYYRSGSEFGNPTLLKYDSGEVSPVRSEPIAGNRILEYGSDSLPIGPFAKNPQRFTEQPTSFIIMSATFDGTPAGTSPWPAYQESLVTNQIAVQYLAFTRGYRSGLYWTVGYRGYDVYDRDEDLTNRNWKLHHSLTGSQGYKYGIQGILPKYSSVIFRPNRYGQFRDMLEQRKYGTFFDEIGISPDGQLTGKTGLRDGPISVRFKSPSEQGFVSGSDPGILGSSNRSTSATSSLPYDDGKFSNWSSVF